MGTGEFLGYTYQNSGAHVSPWVHGALLSDSACLTSEQWVMLFMWNLVLDLPLMGDAYWFVFKENLRFLSLRISFSSPLGKQTEHYMFESIKIFAEESLAFNTRQYARWMFKPHSIWNWPKCSLKWIVIRPIGRDLFIYLFQYSFVRTFKIIFPLPSTVLEFFLVLVENTCITNDWNCCWQNPH